MADWHPEGMLQMTEAQFQAQVVEVAQLYRRLVYHTHDSRRSHRGWPDLAIVVNDVLWLVELKTERGKLTADQERWALALGKCQGVRYATWRPRDWAWIVQVLSGEAA